jgi:Ser/Thr protein kinase RdoA (MazF antagonist)
VHGDVALANTGLSGSDVLLLDVVRFRYALALEDVVAAVDMLRRERLGVAKGLEDAFWNGYSQERTLTEVEEKHLPFFEAAFHVKRLKRAVKHLKKGENEWNKRAAWHFGELGRITGL